MKLRSLAIPKKQVALGGGESFTVRGISASDVFGIYYRNSAELGSLFEQFVGGQDGSDVLHSIEAMIAKFPLLMAEIIAIANGGNPFDDTMFVPDEDTDMSLFPANPITNWQADLIVASKIPAPVQVDALLKIGELTFSSDMPPKKFFGLLVALIQQANAKNQLSDGGSDD